MPLSKNSSQSFSAPQHKEGSRRNDIAAISLFLQPLEREVHMFLQQCNARCICAGEDTSIVPSEKVVGLAGYFWLQQLASLIPGNLAKRRVTSAWSHSDRVLTLNMNIKLPLFWRTWSLAIGQDSATCTHGRDYRDCRASELSAAKTLLSAHWYSLLTSTILCGTEPVSALTHKLLHRWAAWAWAHCMFPTPINCDLALTGL